MSVRASKLRDAKGWGYVFAVGSSQKLGLHFQLLGNEMMLELCIARWLPEQGNGVLHLREVMYRGTRLGEQHSLVWRGKRLGGPLPMVM